jgi:hypothetical protein
MNVDRPKEKIFGRPTRRGIIGRKTERNRLLLLTLLLLKFEQALLPAIRALLLLCCSESHCPTTMFFNQPILAEAQYGRFSIIPEKSGGSDCDSHHFFALFSPPVANENSGKIKQLNRFASLYIFANHPTGGRLLLFSHSKF